MRFLTFTLATTLLATSAMAHEHMAEKKEGWSASVGPVMLVTPAFEGSNNYEVQIVPDVRAEYGEIFSISIPEGARYTVVDNGKYKFGGVVKYKFGRDEDGGSSPFSIGDDTDALQGMGDVDGALEFGGFVEYKLTPETTLKAELLQGSAGHEGLVGELEAEYATRVGKTMVNAGPNMKFSTDDYQQTYFGIDAVQSANTGLDQFDADGGIRSYGVSASMIRPLTQKVVLVGFAGYDRLVGDAADSPLVKERGIPDQFMLGFGASYQFNLLN